MNLITLLPICRGTSLLSFALVPFGFRQSVLLLDSLIGRCLGGCFGRVLARCQVVFVLFLDCTDILLKFELTFLVLAPAFILRDGEVYSPG